ncbi:hypothetical protein AVEN_8622-1 [Araneus ventricosus]|uniref:Uncharacterized protein n=1 Tax=Araneus ventricosus TaxID=182803 RepID=A0A4Y2C2L7_ARAVE|nr:hypothetical protein AVEN_8622-1 [Araneus ventricosus]
MTHHRRWALKSNTFIIVPTWEERTCLLKLDLHDHFMPRKWHGSPPHHSNFQPIHLGRSFTIRSSLIANPSPRARVSATDVFQFHGPKLQMDFKHRWISKLLHILIGFSL